MTRLELPVKLVIEEGDRGDNLSLVAEHDGMTITVELPSGVWVRGLSVRPEWTREVLKELRERRYLYGQEGPDE